MSEERNIYQRIAAAMAIVTYVQKEKKQGMRYSIVSHDDVTAKVRPALLEQGVVYHPIAIEHVQNGNRTEATGIIRFTNIDNPPDHIDVPSFGYGIDDQDKGPGKAMSYMVKYALLKTLGLETGDDPDLDQDVKHKPEANPAPQPQRKSSAQLKRDGVWEPVLAAMNAIRDPEELEEWRSKQDLSEWPMAWQGAFDERYYDRLAMLRDMTSNPPEMADSNVLAAG